MKVVYFGAYNKDHPRNKILLRGLRLNGVEVVEMHDRSPFLWKYIRLFRAHWKHRHKYDYMVVGFPGFTIMPLARLVATAPIIFDAFVSYYDANVFDRKICRPGSLCAKYYLFLDFFACSLADVVLLETQKLIDFVVSTTKVDKRKFRRLFIGADDTVFVPANNAPPGEKFTVLFWGWMIPSHGIEYVLRAAQLLSDEQVEFKFIGGGVEKAKMVALKNELGLKNVTMLPPMDPRELIKYIHEAQVVLGAFGSVPRLRMVVTNKVYEALACAKALITANEGAKEILQDGIHCLFCRPADPQDLADKIRKLKNDTSLRKSLTKEGRQLYEEKFSTKVLGAELKSIMIAS